MPVILAPDPPDSTKHDQRRLADLQAGNAAVERRLNMEGGTIDPVGVLAIHMRTLRRLIVGDDPAMDLRYSIAYQEEVALALAEVEQQVARAKLTSRLVIPNGKG